MFFFVVTHVLGIYEFKGLGDLGVYYFIIFLEVVREFLVSLLIG